MKSVSPRQGEADIRETAVLQQTRLVNRVYERIRPGIKRNTPTRVIFNPK